MADVKKKTTTEKAVEVDVEEQFKAKRQADYVKFQEGYEKLVQECGYRVSPVVTITEAAVVPGLEIVPTK